MNDKSKSKPSKSLINKYKLYKSAQKKYGGVKNFLGRSAAFGTAGVVPSVVALGTSLLPVGKITKSALRTAGALGLAASVPLGVAGATAIELRTNKRKKFIKDFEKKYGKNYSLSDVQVKGTVPEGTFTGDAKSIVGKLMKASHGDVNKAKRKLTYYINRAGTKLPNNNEVYKAREILKKK